MERKLLGTTVDYGPALRDVVLAGGFTSLVMYAATQLPIFLVFGAATGAMLGFVLHILPPEPLPGDDRVGRIIVRTVTGGIAGLGMGPGLAWVTHGAAFDAALTPSNGDMALAGALGLLAGIVWYFGWGIWETRNLAEKTRTAATA